jgi:hypothetical protein
VKNDIWNVTIRVSDGTDVSQWYKVKSVTIKNSLPEVMDLKITPANPKTSDSLTAVYTYNDADSDPEKGSIIEWYRNDQHQTTFDNMLTLPSYATQKDEVWYFTVEPYDDEDYGMVITSPSVKIDNSVPKATELLIIPPEPTTTDILKIDYTYYDADSDPELDTIIKWYRNNDHINELDDTLQVPSSFTNRGEQWRCAVTPKDGYAFGESVYSDIVTIKNSAPEVTDAYIEPNPPALKDDLVAKYTVTDADSDSIVGYTLKWFKNEVEQTELVQKLIISSKYTNPNDTWYFEIQVSDSIEFGPVKVSSAVKINSPPNAKNVIITPTSPTSSDELTASYDWYDEDENDEEIDSIINWYRNDELIDSLTNTLVVPMKMSIKGDSWSFIVIPNDGKDFGLEVKAEAVTIGNSPPTASDLAIAWSHNSGLPILVAKYNYEDIDNDAETDSRIKWYRNQELVKELIDNTFVPSNMLVRDDIWYFTVKPNDGEDFGELVKSPILVLGNIPPIIEEAIITPESPKTNEDLIAEVEYFDTDSKNYDLFQFEYMWYRNDKLVSDVNDWKVIPAGFTSKDEAWYFAVRIYDGVDWSEWYTSSTVTIQNTAPELMDVQLWPDQPVRDKELEITYEYFDLDNDIERDSEIRWYKNGKLVEELNDKSEVPVSYLDMGDEWYCTIKPSDGLNYGDLVESKKVKINTVPNIFNVVLQPSKPTENDKLVLSYEYFDADSDIERNTEIHWYKNNKHLPEYDGMNTIPANIISANERWYATVQPNDGIEFGTEYMSNEVKVVAPKTIEQDVGDKTKSDYTGLIWLIVAIILILVLVILFFIRAKRKSEEEYEQLHEEMIIPYHDYETNDYTLTQIAVSEVEVDKEIEPKSTQAIPLATVLKSIPMAKSDSELSDLPYDKIDVEFKCTKCESEIEAGLETCPVCGEVFGKLI